MRIVIGVPSASTVQAELVPHFGSMCIITANEGHEIMNVSYQASRIERCRNFIIESALQAEADYCLMIDSDMIFPTDGLIRLLEHKKPVVGALYRKRNPGNENQPVTAVDHNLEHFRGGEQGLVQAYMIGMGFVLIDLSIMKDIPKPYFHAMPKSDGDFLGEDYIFCKKVNEAGHSVWLDMDVSREVKHIGKRYIEL